MTLVQINKFLIDQEFSASQSDMETQAISFRLAGLRHCARKGIAALSAGFATQ